MKAISFGKFLQEKLYPHIATENFFGTKVGFLKTFTRSDLVLKKWSNLIVTANNPLASSKLDLRRDATLIVVRDWSLEMREQLEKEEISRYANQAYVDHINKKFNTNAKVDFQHRNHDALMSAAQGRVVDWSKGRKGGPEKGVSIQVGMTDETADGSVQPIMPEDEEIEGEVFIEEFF